ncbi:MAG: saccharopine dehydrogenase NADP-binding domain-containing protein, partial [Deinococcota bacterium]|nr:saccharopine dehydrogenase NADP-binding domain-containing protein [Deinococcota bacterium]
MTFLLYGSYGYTGDLIAREAVGRGLRPVLAGRSGEKLTRQAHGLGLDYRVFGLDDPAAVDEGLAGVRAVLHCAGPFSRTSRPMADACLRTRTHYLDITGEIAVFEALAKRDAEAKGAGVMLLPGAGFDVVPSDCLAAYLKAQLATATQLALGFSGTGRMSRGTATTMVEAMGEGGVIRQGGKLRRVPAAYKTRQIDFGRGPRLAVTIPWGDVSTAFYSTGIPDILVYTALPRKARRALVASRYLGWLLRSPAAQRLLKGRIERQPPGPSEHERKRGRSLLWGEVRDDSGVRLEARLEGPEGYTLTVQAALLITQKVLAGRAPAGFKTPSLAYGADLVLELPGVKRYG